jgi:hypothetical protein
MRIARTRAVVFAAALTFPLTLSAQGVVVQSTSDITFKGALGTIANIASRMGGGNLHDIQSTTSLSGHKMRIETTDAGTIIDADAGRMTTIDHKRKTWTTMTFEEMIAAIEQASRSAEQSAKQETAKKEGQKGEVKFKYKASVDRTGQREKIAGFDAERVFLTLTIEAEATPEGEKTEQAGSLVFLLDQWLSKDAPQIAAMEEFQRAYAQKMGRAFQPSAEALKAAFASDPRIKVAFEASAAELKKLSGISLRSTTHGVAVPAGMTFDRELALGGGTKVASAEAKPEEKPKGGFRSLMGAVKNAAQDAAKSSNAEKKDAPPQQSTLLTISDVVKSISREAVPASTFEVPAGYREVKPR